MLKFLKNSVALSLVLSLSTPGTVFSQETSADCDPASDPECAAVEATPAPAAETSEQEAPAEEVEVQLDDTVAGEAEAQEESTASTEEPVTEEVSSQAEEQAADSSDADGPEAATEEETTDAAPAGTEGVEGEATSEEAASAEGSTAVESGSEAGEPAEGAEAPGETLAIEEPETVLSEDTGLTEEAAAAEAAAVEELSETAPVAAATEEGAITESGVEPETEVTTVTEEAARSSEEEFATAGSGGGGLSTLEKLLVVGVGAAVIGELIDNNKVVQNTGDRVVLQRADGSLYVLRDDDVLLRRPGYNIETRTYSDGSTINEITKSDGSIVRTVRDPRGHVLRRTRTLPSGREITLFDDTAEIDPVDVENLPLRRSSSLDYADADVALEDALSAGMLEDVGRRFSLRQIRNIRAVRELVPVIDLETITFDTGSAAIRASEARKLDRLGNAMKSVIDERPWEVFLIEGHTDAVGSAVANLTLSDRRAESLALALTEYYDIPSENLVVQGYGERYLKVPVATDERANRRVTVRRITPLLGMEVAASGAPNEATGIMVRAVGSSNVSQDAIDSCIDELRATEGATGGTVLRTEFSEANSLVMLSDGSGAVWRCLVSNDGTNPSIEAAEDTATADDGRGAMDGASENGSTAMTTSEVSQDAIDACIDGLRATAGASGGTVESTEFSEANSLVMLRQSSGGLWRCIVSNDGSSASLEAVEGTAGGGDGASADDGGGAMDGASAETETPSAGSSTDVSDFVGAPAGQASGGLQALGFESIRTEGLTTYWFNRDTGACARITTSEGVFSEVVMLPAEDC